MIRILHVDDEPDIREIVEVSLGLDPGVSTRSCGSGREAIPVAADWQPDIILLDVMMPVLDGPATFLELQRDARTAGIPVIFMTARAQAREVDRFRALGGVGVIPKPFDPMTLAASVRRYLKPARDPLDDLRAAFLLRVKRDVLMLSQERVAISGGSRSPDALNRVKHLAHGLSGAGGIYGFAELSNAGATLEDAVIAEIEDGGPGSDTDRALDGLIAAAGKSGDAADHTGRARMEA